MRPRLEAEERVELMAITQAATGHMDKRAREDFVRELHMRMRAGEPERGARPRSMDELLMVPGLVVVEDK